MSATRHLTSLLCLSLVLSALEGCAFIEFEPSPYTPRALQSVYSSQEDLTFLSWRVRDSADLELVRFELWDPREQLWRAIKLSEAPYPASPYSCGAQDTCLQFQVEGRLSWPETGLEGEPPPLRSIHEDGGVYGPIEFRQRAVDETLSVDPIAIDANLRFDARPFDWFSDNRVPLKRSFEWRRLKSNAGLGEDDAETHHLRRCRLLEPLDPWSPLTEPLLPEAWTDEGACLVVRPVSPLRGFEPVEVVAPLPPSALLKHRGYKFLAPLLTPPAFFITLTDMQIRSEIRCGLLKAEILTSLRTGFSRFPRGSREDLGDYLPIEPVGAAPLSGCEQRGDRRYPIIELLERIKGAVNPLAPEPVSLVIAYLNNSQDPLSDHLALGLELLFSELAQISHLKVFGIKVTGEVSPPGPWRHWIPWRALEISSFEEQIKNLTKQIFPFRTMDFISGETPISLPSPAVSSSPLSFKLCELSPDRFMWIDSDASPDPIESRDEPLPWGEGRDPALYVELEEQDRVQDKDYYEQPVSIEYEVCTRFCDYPFRAQSGADYSSWAQVNACQWGRRR